MSANVNPSYCIPFVTTTCSFGSNCSLRHDIFACSCGNVLPLSVRKEHTRGKKHKEALSALVRGESLGQRRNGSSRNRAATHPDNVRNRTHIDLCHSLIISPYNCLPEQEQIHCVHCRKSIDSVDYDAHAAEHIRQQHFDQVRAALEEAKDDKEGVTVTGRNGIDFGILDTEKPVEFMIDVSSALSRVSIRKCRIAPSVKDGVEGPKFSAHLRGKGRVVQKGSTRKVSLIFQPSYAGHVEATLELLFFDIDNSRTFVITRTVEATVGSREDYEELKPKAPYARRKAVPKFNYTGLVVRNNRPPTWTKTLWADRLLGYDPPSRLIEVAYGPRSLGSPKQLLSNVKKFMPTIFNEKTYGAWFQVLLHLEEQQVKLVSAQCFQLFNSQFCDFRNPGST